MLRCMRTMSTRLWCKVSTISSGQAFDVGAPEIFYRLAHGLLRRPSLPLANGFVGKPPRRCARWASHRQNEKQSRHAFCWVRPQGSGKISLRGSPTAWAACEQDTAFDETWDVHPPPTGTGWWGLLKPKWTRQRAGLVFMVAGSDRTDAGGLGDIGPEVLKKRREPWWQRRRLKAQG